MLQLHTPIRRFEKWVHLNRDLWREHRERLEGLRRPAEFWSGLDERIYQETEPVFFLSTGRCGTELISSLLRRMPGVLAYHEPFPVLVSTERKAYENGAEQFEAFKLAIHACRFELLADCHLRNRRYVETNHRMTFLAPHLHAMFPQARFVHLVRHPGSFVRSGVSRGYYEGQYTDLGRIVPRQGPAAVAWPAMTGFERCAWLWNETNAFVEKFRRERGSDRTITIRSEDLFKDASVMLQIVEHCGLPPLSMEEIRRALARPVNAQGKSNQAPPYAQWDEETKEQVRRWAALADHYEYAL